MLYADGGKFYIKVSDGYREVEVFKGENSFGYKAIGETVKIDGSLPAYTIEEIIAKFNITGDDKYGLCNEEVKEVKETGRKTRKGK